jgi:hypothetical protein
VAGRLEPDVEAGVVLAAAGGSRRRASSSSGPNNSRCLGVCPVDLLRCRPSAVGVFRLLSGVLDLGAITQNSRVFLGVPSLMTLIFSASSSASVIELDDGTGCDVPASVFDPCGGFFLYSVSLSVW